MVVRDRIELSTFRFSGECRFVRVTGVLDASRARTCVACVLGPEISTTRAYATRTRVSTQPAQGSYAEASATPMEGGTMSIPSLSSRLIASAR